LSSSIDHAFFKKRGMHLSSGLIRPIVNLLLQFQQMWYCQQYIHLSMW